MDYEHETPLPDDPASRQGTPLSPPTVEEYREYLDEFQISEQQKEELLRTIWWIAVAFVDIGWDVDSVQLCLPALRELSLEGKEDALKGTDPTEDFNSTATCGESAPKP